MDVTILKVNVNVGSLEQTMKSLDVKPPVRSDVLQP